SAGGAGRRRARATSLLELVGLGDRLNALPNQLSGGQRQRVAIARALANNPAIVLADEPTGNLDSKTTAEILELLCELNRTQVTTLIVVTHNPQVAREARRVVTIRDGLIQRDVVITNRFATDLLDWKASGLGQAILQGQNVPAELRGVVAQLKDLLEKV
ncbi:MAG: ABC transporter ATP-binding protein, partial [Chloroflexota bacterium]